MLLGKVNPPSLDQLAGDGPHTRAREHIPVKHTEFEFVLCLLQLPDHLMDEFKVALAVADEGVKHLRGTCI